MNTLLYTKRLEQMGVSRENAEAFVTVSSEMIMNEVATKADLQIIRADLNLFRAELNLLETRLTIRLGAMVSASSILTIAILTYLK